MAELSGFDIICISTSHWERPWGSRQQLMSRLSGGNRVLFVEYQLSFLHYLRYPRLLKKLFQPRLKIVSDKLMVYRPWMNLPFRYYSKGINLFNQRLLLSQLKRLIKKHDFRNIILWIFESTACLLPGKFKERLSIFHSIDLHYEEKSLGLRKGCIREMEKILCAKCDIVIVSTEEISHPKAAFNKEIHLIPSAVDSSFIEASHLGNMPDEFKRIPSPRIGFVGTFDHRLDYRLLEFIARQRKDWSLVFVGQTQGASEFSRLKNLANVFTLGWIDHQKLPAYIKAFDTCIIPYKVNSFTRGISPIKAFEYLALGKPVVSTDLPALRSTEKDGLLTITYNREDFLKQIEECLVKNSQALIERRIKFAKENTWEKRIDLISKIIDNYLRR